MIARREVCRGFLRAASCCEGFFRARRNLRIMRRCSQVTRPRAYKRLLRQLSLFWLPEPARGLGYCTFTVTAREGIPFATTSRMLMPRSWSAGTSK